MNQFGTPVPGEALSSWIARTSWVGPWDASFIAHCISPSCRLLTMDPEWARISPQGEHVPDGGQSTLVNSTFLSKASLEGGVSRRHIVPYGSRGLRKRQGFMYCPCCLAECGVAQYPLDWRMAFSVRCQSHQSRLRDRCTRCSAPVLPVLSVTRGMNPGSCWRCGMQYTRAGPAQHCSEANILTSNCIKNLLQGSDLESANTMEFMAEISELSLALIRMLHRDGSARLAAHVMDVIGPIPRILPDPAPFCRLSVEDRTQVMSVAGRLASSWWEYWRGGKIRGVSIGQLLGYRSRPMIERLIGFTYRPAKRIKPTPLTTCRFYVKKRLFELKRKIAARDIGLGMVREHEGGTD